MDYNGAIKGMKIVGIIFIGLSIIEIIFLIILSITELNFSGDKILVSELILSSKVPVSVPILWVFLISSFCCFLFLGLVMIFVSNKKNLDAPLLAKHLTIVGMMTLVFSFVKLEYIVLLANTNLDYGYTFQQALYSTKISSTLAGFIWLFMTGVVCGYLIIGLVVAASGIKWTIEIEKVDAGLPEEGEESTIPAP